MLKMGHVFVVCLLAAVPAGSAVAEDDAIAAAIQKLTGNTNPSVEDWSVHAQATEIIQGYPAYHAAYSGANSLPASGEWRNTTSATLFLGHRLWKGGEVYFDPELYEGKGVGDSFGIAGFPNGEANKAGAYDFKYGNARLFVRQVIGLGGETESIAAGQNQLASVEDISRITVTAGKFAASDIFDNNAYSHDPRTQFMNWGLMDSAAWDYPANARGYTQGAVVELNQKAWAVRYGVFLEPRTPNGNDLTFRGVDNIAQAAELEERYALYDKPGTVRVTVFWNRNDGSYYHDAFAMGGDINSAIVQSRQFGNNKLGFAVNAEQQLAGDVGIFARASWNDGLTEDTMFTDVDESLVAGMSMKGERWSRSSDTVGLAGIINGISSEHRQFLAEGGNGIIIGDGRLHYAPEMIAEAYYSIALNAYLSFSPDYQVVSHPAYNADRGPVSLFAARLHAAF